MNFLIIILIYLFVMQELEDELEKLRLVLTDADSVCEQLCDIMSDSTSKSDIKYKVTVLETSYTTLRKKIGMNLICLKGHILKLSLVLFYFSLKSIN